PLIIESCGNGARDPGEECDDGNKISGDACRADCLGEEVCGDGLVDPAVGEVCDDGNPIIEEPCSLDCTTITSTGFASEELNGLNPSEAKTAVFGEGTIATTPGGSPDARVLLIIASSDPDVCTTIQASSFTDSNGDSHSGLDAFL